jgi:hypothetical protein
MTWHGVKRAVPSGEIPPIAGACAQVKGGSRLGDGTLDSRRAEVGGEGWGTGCDVSQTRPVPRRDPYSGARGVGPPGGSGGGSRSDEFTPLDGRVNGHLDNKG